MAGVSDSFRQAKEQGATDDSAFRYAVLSQIPQILLDRLGIKDIKSALAQKWNADKGFFAKLLENIKAQSVTGATNQAVELFLENLILSDASRLEKVYDEAYQKAIDEGRDSAGAQNAGRIAQLKELVTNIGMGALENMQGNNIGELFKQIFKKSE